MRNPLAKRDRAEIGAISVLINHIAFVSYWGAKLTVEMLIIQGDTWTFLKD
jgi:hypothetical protein